MIIFCHFAGFGSVHNRERCEEDAERVHGHCPGFRSVALLLGSYVHLPSSPCNVDQLKKNQINRTLKQGKNYITNLHV